MRNTFSPILPHSPFTVTKEHLIERGKDTHRGNCNKAVTRYQSPIVQREGKF